MQDYKVSMKAIALATKKRTLNMQNTHKLLLIISIAFYLPNANAFTCFEKSPSYFLQGDKYFETYNEGSLSPKEKEEFSKIYSKIKGKWVGNSSEIICKGTEKKPNPVHRTFIVEKAEFRTGGRNTLKASIQKKNTERSGSGSGSYSLFTEDGLVSIQIDKNNIYTSEKFRRANAGGGSRLIEIITALEVQNDSFTLQINYYSNGYSTGQESFFFHNRR